LLVVAVVREDLLVVAVVREDIEQM